ncbi:MAG: amino acid permease [Gemmatimonadota bacterium]|jgi:APA family basic amino acid/polyamine antiporter
MSSSTEPGLGRTERLPKELGLFDVYAISTGAMFSSGFFLLPGLAAAQTGPSVPLAYLVAGIFILPAMLSVAELATAMPRAGGAYYFLDRSLGPMVGTVGGLGTWLALVLKSAFALVGMGAYLGIYFDVPIEPLAVALTLAFMAINIMGAKETSGLQRILVSALVAILGFFIAQGLGEVFSMGIVEVTRERFTPFLPFGLAGFMGTVGFVFVSYAGLTKVASVSEEIQDPDRNIPLGMGLSLATAAVVYSVGVYIIVAVLPPEALRDDLTPVATAAEAFFDWLPGGLGVGLIVVAAIAAFASTGNAGIMSASRYPLAMARDRLVSPRFATLGRFKTPTFSIVVTALLMVVAILVLDVANIAKLASAFQLLLFSLLSLAVVIMRESGIEGYDPGYRSPFYPWMQIFGFLSPLWLIAEMGELAILFTMGLVAVTIGWYFRYARDRVDRTGAIFHTFARLGTLRHTGLDVELRSIVREKGLREQDPWDRIIARAQVLECTTPVQLSALAQMAADRLAPGVGVPAEILQAGFLSGMEAGYMPVAHGAALPHIRLDGIPEPVMVLVRCSGGVEASGRVEQGLHESLAGVRAVIFLVSPDDDAGQHLRLLGFLASRVDDPGFLGLWMAARDATELRESLLREERWLSLQVGSSPRTEEWSGRAIRELELPSGSLVALVRRDGHGIIPRGDTVLQAGDDVTIIGEPEVIRTLAGREARADAASLAQGPDQP